MRVNGKEVFEDDILQAIIDRDRHAAVSLVRARHGLTLIMACNAVSKTMIELGIGKPNPDNPAMALWVD